MRLLSLLLTLLRCRLCVPWCWCVLQMLPWWSCWCRGSPALLYQSRTALVLLMRVLLLLVFCCHNVLLLQRSPVDCSDCFNSLLYAGSCNPKYAVILNFHSSKVLYPPVNRGGDILYLWIPSNCCCSCCCCCCDVSLTTVYLNLWVCGGAHPGLWWRIACQGSLLRYTVKVELTV